MAIIILIVLLFAALVFFGKTPVTIKGNWKHFYDNVQISTSEFYEQVRAGLKERKINASVTKESFLESHVFSAKREYLRITEREYVFYICAAPFGTGTFVSWWLCIKNEKAINKVPLLSKLAGKDRNNKTFYQMDTESMYQSVIHSTVTAVADGMTETKGVRLSDLERQYKEGNK